MRYFLYLLLVNLLLLASLEKRFTCRELDCFLRVEDDDLKEDDLVNEATGDIFALFWETAVKKALSYFWK